MTKTLIVTGASSDMGCELLENSADDYGAVFIQYRAINERLKAAIKGYAGIRVVECRADLVSETDLQTLIQKLNEFLMNVKNPQIHMVHFPASKLENNKFNKISWSIYQEALNISLRSFVDIGQLILPVMVKSKNGGRILFMLSAALDYPPPKYCTCYVTVKYALLGLMKSLAIEYADKGITINGVSPSWVNTKYVIDQPEIIKIRQFEASPIGRNLETTDIIPTIRFLLSEPASCINGENIRIACGR